MQGHSHRFLRGPEISVTGLVARQLVSLLEIWILAKLPRVHLEAYGKEVIGKRLLTFAKQPQVHRPFPWCGR